MRPCSLIVGLALAACGQKHGEDAAPSQPSDEDTGPRDSGRADDTGDPSEPPPDFGLPRALSLSEATARLLAEGEKDKAGYSLARLGDGAGGARLAVGARFAAGVGAVYLVAGPLSGTSSLGEAGTLLRGEADLDEFGARVAEAGDLDQDGYPELLTSALGLDEGADQAGGALLFAGPLSGAVSASGALARFVGEGAGDGAGDAVAGLGDVDGDGVADLIIGASNASPGLTAAGSSYLLLGPLSGAGGLADADARLRGDAAYDTAGNAVIGVGDADGDGLNDLAIGAPHRDDRGVATEGLAAVFLGPPRGELTLSEADALHRGEDLGQRAGADLAGGVDVDGDGYGDLAVGAHSWGDDEAGAAYLVTAAGRDASLTDASLRIEGEGATGWLGVRLDFVGDLDGDGGQELAVGAKFHDGAAEDAGMTYIFFSPLPSGTLRATDAPFTLLGVAAGDESGMDIAPAGDWTGDGLDDLAVGAQGEATLGENAGAAYLISLNAGL